MQMDAETSGEQPKPNPSVYAKTQRHKEELPRIQIFMLYIDIGLFLPTELFFKTLSIKPRPSDKMLSLVLLQQRLNLPE